MQMGSVPATEIRASKQNSLISTLLPATLNLCKAIGLSDIETFQVWQRVHVKFISIPKLGITRHDLTIFILDTLRERRQRGLCRPEI